MPFDHKRIQPARVIHSHNKHIENAFQRAMRRRNMRIATLALRAGVHRRAVQLITRGHIERVSFWTIARLAHALKLDLNYLAGLNPTQKGRPHGGYTIPD
jgi:DNA-binding Xre family transcriptional regulator